MSSYTVRMNDILGRFAEAFSEVAPFDLQSVFRAENATYGEAYLAPKSKLGSVLLTSREVLLLVADFTEIQTRSLRVAEDRIEKSRGRLESTILVLAHRDPKANDRLRTWGRERGLTVLPLDFSRGIPTGEEIFDELCADLYSHDPYDVAGPVRDEHQFFGRPFAPDMARRLAQGHVQALFGLRKIGKTSLLNRLIAELVDHSNAICVMADASDDNLWSLDPASVISGITQGIEEGRENGYASIAPMKVDYSAAASADELLELVVGLDTPIVVFIDEVDYITPSSPVSDTWEQNFNVLFRALRRVYQETARQRARFSIVVSGVSSYWFSVETVQGVENAALAFVPETYLTPLQREESQLLVERLGRTSGLIVDTKASDLMAAYSSDMPFWLRRLGSYVHSCYPEGDRPIHLHSGEIRALCDEFVEIQGSQLAYSSLRHLFRIYPELGSAAVACVEGRTAKINQELLSILGRYGLLGEKTGPSGPMVEAGIRRWADSDGSASAALPVRKPEPMIVEAGSISSAGEEEWALLLMEVSKMRNTVEHQLRQVLLAVLRAESASKGTTASELLLKAVPHDRRETLSGLSASKIVKAMYWTDLLQTIRKHWRLFESFIGDRSKFDLYGDILNDRPDAHAKDLDGADLALQRRAFEWFSKTLDASGLL